MEEHDSVITPQFVKHFLIFLLLNLCPFFYFSETLPLKGALFFILTISNTNIQLYSAVTFV